jgi:cytoplasmic FMR1 interacting protein
MLVDHVIESWDTGLLESVLLPFDIYNDSAEYALHILKQRFLYDEIEAEVGIYRVQLFYIERRYLS